MTCFLYSFPLGLCIRLWDNILAFGTRFIFNISLSILSLLKDQLIELDFGDINEFFKSLKDDSHLEEKLLPPFEVIIQESVKIYISEDKMEQLFDKYKPMPKVQRPQPNPLKKLLKKEEVPKQEMITVPPKQVAFGAEITGDDAPLIGKARKSKKGKKGKKKKEPAFEKETLIQVLGGSEAIRRIDNTELQLEDIVNDNEEAYVNEHHTEIQNHGGSTMQ